MRCWQWLAAAMSLGATQAEAQTFTQYRVGGTGNIEYFNVFNQVTGYQTGNFVAIFSVLTSPGFYGQPIAGQYESDGSVFKAQGFYGDEGSNGAVSGILTYQQSNLAPGYGFNANVSTSYIGNDAIGSFPLSVNGSAGTSSITVDLGNYEGGNGGYHFNGRITSFAVLGPSNVFRLISLSVPEPVAWLTLILGFGMLGAALRRRDAGPARPATT